VVGKEFREQGKPRLQLGGLERGIRVVDMGNLVCSRVSRNEGSESWARDSGDRETSFAVG
jgi:hypothetical protein